MLYSPLSDNGVVFHAAGVRFSNLLHTRVKGPKTHLLMLSILSILVIPSQCRMSGIRAWKRISLTPAMFSVRLK